MLKLILIDIKRLIMSPQIYIAFLIVIASSIISYQNNYYYFGLNNINNIGAINLFLYSNVINTLGIVILAALIAVLPYCDALLVDYRSGFVKNIITKTGETKYYASKILSACMFGGGIFVFAFLCELGIYVIVDQMPSVMISPPNGIFSLVYASSMLNFCLLFIAHSFIYGFVFALFGCGLALNFRNKIFIYIIPLFLYYVSSTLYQFLPGRLIPEFLYYVLPFDSFVVYESLVPGYQHYSQLVVLSIISIILIVTGIKKRKVGFNL